MKVINKKIICFILIFCSLLNLKSVFLLNNDLKYLYANNKNTSSPINNENIRYFENSEIHLLHSVTNAQCLSMIIKEPSGKIIVFDGGWREDKDHFIDTVKSLSDKVDYWFVTHEDSDHVGCLDAILEDDTNPLQIENLYREPFIPLIIDIGTTSVTLLNDPYECNEDTVNNSSRCYKIILEGKSILITGDLGQEGGNNLLRILPKEELQSDFLQMPHHGAHYTMKEFYEAVNPKVCIWPTYNGTYLANWRVMKTKEVMKELGVKNNIYLDKKDIIIR